MTPHGWRTVSFGSLATLGPQNGIYKSKDAFGSGSPLIDMGEMFASDIIGYRERRMVRLSTAEVSRFSVQPGDLLFARRSLVAAGSGKCTMVGNTGQTPVFESSIIRIRLDEKIASPAFYLQFWASPSGLALRREITRQVAVSGVTGKDLARLPVPVPPLAEQRKIAEVLGSVDEAIGATRAVIEQTRRVKQGLLQQLLTRGIGHTRFKKTEIGVIPEGWEVVTMRDICTVRQGLQIPINERHKENAPGRHVYITIKYLHTTDKQAVAQYIANPSPRVVCRNDDILVARTGATGKIVTDVAGVFHNNFFLVDYRRDCVERDFLVNYLESDRIQNEIHLRAGTTTIPDLNHGDFYSMVLVRPPAAEQAEIALRIQAFSHGVTEDEQVLNSLLELKRGLMQDLLTGRVRVKV